MPQQNKERSSKKEFSSKFKDYIIIKELLKLEFLLLNKNRK